MQKLDHPNTVKLIKSVDTHKYLHLVMEYVGGHSLNHYMKRRKAKRIEEGPARKIFR